VTGYQEVNRANWDDRVPVHVDSPDYHVERYVAEPDLISNVVRFDLPLLGDVTGLRGVHLQCHIGTDTISLARLGASMTGLDFSGPAIEAAAKLAARAGADATFVRSDVYAAPDVLGTGGFDLVYTGVGALPWLPDIRRWARVVAALLRPGGRLFVRDGHPMLQALEVRDSLPALEYPYFEQPEPMVWDDDRTYVQTDARVEHTVMHQWNHGIGETVTALVRNGLQLEWLVEHDWTAFPAFPWLVQEADRNWHVPPGHARIPLSFSLLGRRPL